MKFITTYTQENTTYLYMDSNFINSYKMVGTKNIYRRESTRWQGALFK